MILALMRRLQGLAGIEWEVRACPSNSYDSRLHGSGNEQHSATSIKPTHSLETHGLSFPKDYGCHTHCQSEWWYLSGQLLSDDGTEWGYQFTIFRRNLQSWRYLALVLLGMSSKTIRNSQVFKNTLAGIIDDEQPGQIGVEGYVGHLAITNVSEGLFKFFQRGGASLFNVAGSQEGRLDVWLKDWKLIEMDHAMRLLAEREEFGISLDLVPKKGPVPHGCNGLVTKSPGSHRTSHHYSMTSLASTGWVNWDGKKYPVSGSTWMDREYGTAMLPSTAIGWDWFALMLENQHELMISRIRYAKNYGGDMIQGTIVLSDGSWQNLNAPDITIEPTCFWKSTSTEALYPVEWNISIREPYVRLHVSPVINDHELITSLSTSVDYWEGPVRVTGTMKGSEIAGKGYVELVGYAQAVGGKF